MFSISFSIEMPDLDNIDIEIDCPICALQTKTTLGDIRFHSVAICRGCHANIWLEDHLGQYARARKQFAKSLTAAFDGV